MNQTENMLTAEDRLFLTAGRLIAQGLAILLGNPNAITGTVPEIRLTTPAAESKAETAKTELAKPKAEPEKPAAAVNQDKPKAEDKTKADASQEKTETSDAKKISRSDLERAMAAKVKALAAQGSGPAAIGQLFPKFHGAQCVSDLTEADYPAFLEELSKL